ncbi:MAG: sigma-E factor negative regulatory protein [Burkholderiales bacterium]
MKERVSALMDGELEPHDFPATFASLRESGEALDAWRTYHLISDALRDTRLTSDGFADRVAARIAEEPTVLAPRTADRQVAQRPRWMALSAAASVAAVALVGWVALAPQPGSGPDLVARTAQPMPQAPLTIVKAPVEIKAKAPAALQLTDAADDYLLAHQAYSPRNSFQGVAPYVRTVSTRSAEGGR